jgi:N-acetyl-anhydromuramyl-L-alanine amidase AmpD
MPKLPDLYPILASVHNPSALSKGAFEGNQPAGVTIATTGERNLARVLAACAAGREGYHLVIDREGRVHQTAYLTQRVNHAGKAQWLCQSPNKAHISVGLISFGKLLPGPQGTWLSNTGVTVRSSHVALRPGNTERGNAHWDACTIAQETTLYEVLTYLVAQGIGPSNVCGLDECSLPNGREHSPGGALSMTTVELREKLRAG